MMIDNIKEKVKTDIQELIKFGDDMCNHFSNLFFTRDEYNQWYTKAYKIIKIFLPERFEEFISYYNGAWNSSSATGFNIQKHMLGQFPEDKKYMEPIERLFKQQLSLLKSVLNNLNSKIIDINLDLNIELNETELQTAVQLKNVNLRASGCIAGIVLEKHLKAVLNTHIPNHGKKDKELTLNTINDLLKDNLYDNKVWKNVQYLSEIRNLCDHAKVDDNGNIKEPTVDDIETIISGTEKILKTVY